MPVGFNDLPPELVARVAEFCDMSSLRQLEKVAFRTRVAAAHEICDRYAGPVTKLKPRAVALYEAWSGNTVAPLKSDFATGNYSRHMLATRADGSWAPIAVSLATICGPTLLNGFAMAAAMQPREAARYGLLYALGMSASYQNAFSKYAVAVGEVGRDLYDLATGEPHHSLPYGLQSSNRHEITVHDRLGKQLINPAFGGPRAAALSALLCYATLYGIGALLMRRKTFDGYTALGWLLVLTAPAAAVLGAQYGLGFDEARGPRNPHEQRVQVERLRILRDHLHAASVMPGAGKVILALREVGLDFNLLDDNDTAATQKAVQANNWYGLQKLIRGGAELTPAILEAAPLDERDELLDGANAYREEHS